MNVEGYLLSVEGFTILLVIHARSRIPKKWTRICHDDPHVLGSYSTHTSSSDAHQPKVHPLHMKLQFPLCRSKMVCSYCRSSKKNVWCSCADAAIKPEKVWESIVKQICKTHFCLSFMALPCTTPHTSTDQPGLFSAKHPVEKPACYWPAQWDIMTLQRY
jgi:hypothetical protein